MLSYSGFNSKKIKKIWPELSLKMQEISQILEANAKYAPYLQKQNTDIKLLLQEEGYKIPKDFNFSKILALSTEVREKLSAVKPQTIAQAKRIPGVTPAAAVSILIHLKNKVA